MSVIIRGMKMPKDCHECMIRADCPVGTQRFIVTGRPRGCLLVEISTPHGRLIDAGKLKSRLVLDNDSNELQRISADILKWIDIQETVIEGSET